MSHSFVFLEKIGKKKEQQLWARGITDWITFLRTENIPGISKQVKDYYDRRIREAQKALATENTDYFTQNFPAKEHWRLYDHWKDECGFLDIETDSQGKVIVVGISNYFTTNHFVRGVNLGKELLEKELSKYNLLVTFNGAAFDLPKLEKQLQLQIGIPHIDLKPLCVNQGLKGGLKEVEKMLKLKRPQHLYGNPVELWKAFHASGDREWLDLLLAYNTEDVENLKRIMDNVYQQLSDKIYKQIRPPSGHGFQSHPL